MEARAEGWLESAQLYPAGNPSCLTGVRRDTAGLPAPPLPVLGPSLVYVAGLQSKGFDKLTPHDLALIKSSVVPPGPCHLWAFWAMYLSRHSVLGVADVTDFHKHDKDGFPISGGWSERVKTDSMYKLFK